MKPVNAHDWSSTHRHARGIVPWPHTRPANPEKLVILIGKETRLPIIAALDDMQRNSG
jgi:hypothetical protein